MLGVNFYFLSAPSDDLVMPKLCQEIEEAFCVTRVPSQKVISAKTFAFVNFHLLGHRNSHCLKHSLSKNDKIKTQ